jgi:hypothetical protein
MRIMDTEEDEELRTQLIRREPQIALIYLLILSNRQSTTGS